LPAQAMAHALAAEVQSFSAREQFDDITLIIAKKSG
jgi:serine phosphatase RsbU (regulator of sigma subunit)